MPPKRKGVSNTTEEIPTKRHTRSSGSVLVPLTRAAATSATKHKAPIRTYGRNQRNGLAADNSLKENESQESLGKAAKVSGDGGGAGGEESSEDELNLTQSSKSPVVPGGADSSTGKRSGRTRPALDAETPTRKPRRAKRIDTHSAKPSRKSSRPAEETSEVESDEPTSSASLRKPQTSPRPAKSVIRNQTIDSQDALLFTQSTKRPKKVVSQIQTTDEPRSDDQTPAAIPNPRRITRSSPIKSPVKSSATCRPARRKQLEHNNRSEAPPVTPVKRSGKLPKRELEQDRESPSTGPSPKKLRFDTDVASSLPNSKPHQTSHTPSRYSSPTDLTLGSTSNLPSKHSTGILTPSRISLSKRSIAKHPTHTRVTEVLPLHLHSCLNAQKKALLHALQRPIDCRPNGDDDEEDNEETEPETNEVAFQQLHNLLVGTVNRGEGNSCLILGPRGSGKTRLVERCISNIPDKPIILWLSGWTQHSDRLAMREIAYQLGQQTGTTFLAHPGDISEGMDGDDADNESNPFLDKPATSIPISGTSLPPSTHLPALISVLPTLSRSTIVVLDGFDLFSLHPRQSLLYCLLDTAQSCRASASSKGLAIIGITSRVDTINLLEKRVKSRFSGRILRTAPPGKLENWVRLAKAALEANVSDIDREDDHSEEWKSLWNIAIDGFLGDKAVSNVLNETFSITRDVRMLNKMLVSLTLQLTPTSPFPSASQFTSTALSQRARPRFPFLHTLSYPALCLLIASVHTDTAGHSTFTFEMLHEYFHDQVRASTSAPVQVNGGSIGMVRCRREVLMSAFEHLASIKVFICIVPSPNIAKEFVKYRSVVAREDVKKAVDKTGQINLRKWFTKAQ